MDKAKLAEILKQNGLDLAEDTAKMAVKAVFKVLPEIVKETENKMDDILIPLISVVEKPVMELLDKIDGQEG
jgi:hypothetical protein